MSTVCLLDFVSHPNLLLNIVISYSLYFVNIFFAVIYGSLTSHYDSQHFGPPASWGGENGGLFFVCL